MSDNEEYVKFARARGGITSAGLMYEVKIALWLFIRGLSKRINFELACNVADLGNFDDIIFKYEEDGKWNAILVQLKHKENEVLDEKFLFDKLLYQCCDSYVKINNKNFKKEKGMFKGLTISDLYFVIFTNGKLPEKHCQLKSANNHFLNEFLNINLYLNEKVCNRATYFDEMYYNRCICESFKAYASQDVLKTKSDLKSYFEAKFGTDHNKTIVSSIQQLTNKEIIDMLGGEESEFYRDYEKFLADVVLFHNQPNETELDKFILDEIKDVTDLNPNEVYNELLDYFTEWHDKSNIVLTNSNIYQVLQKYSKPNTVIRKYFYNQSYISRNIYKNGEKNNAFVVNRIEDITDKTPMIISGAAGMGKTSFINYVFQLNSTKLWMHKIKLNVSYNILKSDVKSNIQLLKKFIPYINKAKSDYMIRLLDECKLLIMVDGFDEIDEYFNGRIITFLKFLSSKCPLVVTTRTNYAQTLADQLNGNLYSLKELSEDDCVVFIKKHCNLEKISELLQKIELIFKNRQSFLYNFILQNPLHLRMYLEYINNEDKTQSNADSLYSFYKSFIDEKIKIYLSRIGMKNVSESSSIFDSLGNGIKKIHKQFAIQYLNFDDVDDDDEKKQHLEVDNFLSNEDLIKIGFVDYFDSCRQPSFSHRTFAEYFYALHLTEHLDKEKYCKIITKHVIDNEFLGNILNTIIIHDSAKRFNIIDDDIELFKRNKKFHQKDAFGRTSLHLAFAVGAIQIATFLINENFYQGIAEHIKHETPLHYLIENKMHFNADVIKKVINKCGVNCVNYRNNTPLHVAVENDFREIIELLMNDTHCNVNYLNIYGKTPLLIACTYNHIEIAEILLTNDKCDPNLFNNFRENALLIAAQNGHTKLIELLINSTKLDTNCVESSNNTPLHLAAYNNYPKIVDLLLRKMISQINSFNANQCSPLYYAAMRGNTKVVETLLNYEECDVNLMNRYNDTALHMAAYFGHLAVVELLIKQRTCNVNALNNYNDSPFHIAIRNNFIEIVNLLMLNEKCDINLTNNYNNTPLHLAARADRQELVKLLITADRCRINSVNNNNETALHLAVLNSNKEIVQLLIEHEECDLNVVNKKHCSPLHSAIRLNSLEIVELLIANAKCNINCSNDNFITPLHMAVRFGNLDIIELLLNDENCDINCVTYNNETPLHFAVESEYVRIVELLVDREDCYLNCRKKNYDTPLHIAVRKKKFDVVQLLINKSRCRLNCRNNNGETPMMIATINGFTNIINLLRNKSDAL